MTTSQEARKLDYRKLWLRACKAYDEKNPSGCVCNIDPENDEIRSPCALHKDWLEAAVDSDRKARQQEAPEMFTAEQVHAAEERARADERRNWTFVKSRIAYRGFSYGMGSQDGIDDLRRAIERNRHD